MNANKVFFRLSLVFCVFTVAFLMSCKSSDNSDPENWWFRNGMVSGGIKSMDFGFYTSYYDKNGREIHSKSSVDETFNEYDPDGLLIMKGLF